MHYLLIIFISFVTLLSLIILYHKFYKKENNINLVSNKLNRKNWSRMNPALERKYPGRFAAIGFGNSLNMDQNYYPGSMI